MESAVLEREAKASALSLFMSAAFLLNYDPGAAIQGEPETKGQQSQDQPLTLRLGKTHVLLRSSQVKARQQLQLIGKRKMENHVLSRIYSLAVGKDLCMRVSLHQREDLTRHSP